ncbi:hypothetical protein ECARS42123_1118, partial [Escherichia coli ARS4.2123]
RKIFSLREYLR